MTRENIAIGRYVIITASRIPWAYCCRGYIVGGDKVAGTIQVFIEKGHDCEFYTFFVEEVDLATEEPLFASVQDCMQPMQPADLSALKHLTPLPPRRPLSSLTETECVDCFRVAFAGRGLPVGKPSMRPVEIDGEVRIRQGWDAELVIFVDGAMAAFEPSPVAGALRFNAAPLVRYLDSIGIEIG